jgi:hypothetical protein
MSIKKVWICKRGGRKHVALVLLFKGGGRKQRVLIFFAIFRYVAVQPLDCSSVSPRQLTLRTTNPNPNQ